VEPDASSCPTSRAVGGRHRLQHAPEHGPHGGPRPGVLQTLPTPRRPVTAVLVANQPRARHADRSSPTAHSTYSPLRLPRDDTFTFRATDARDPEQTSHATVTLIVSPPNSAPVVPRGLVLNRLTHLNIAAPACSQRHRRRRRRHLRAARQPGTHARLRASRPTVPSVQPGRRLQTGPTTFTYLRPSTCRPRASRCS